MKQCDFDRIRNMIRALWKDAIVGQDAYDAWYNSLRRYDFDLIKAAVESYIRIGKFEPKPADIIGQIKKPAQTKGDFNPTPVFEEINGKKQRVFKCRRCKDSGMITWEDENRYLYGVPCDCPAGHYYYHWGWLTQEEQTAYINEHGHHGERIGENWYQMQPC